jgi:hypothetical protein
VSPPQSDRDFELFGHAESYFFAGLNLDWLAGHWISAGTSGAVADLQAF